MSPQLQTTRSETFGVYTGDQKQIIFVDASGVYKPKNELDDFTDESSYSALSEVDVVLFMAEPKPAGKGDQYVAELLKKIKEPVFSVINKIDKIHPDKLLSIIDSYKNLDGFVGIAPISTSQGNNVFESIKTIVGCLPGGLQSYDADQLTDRSEYFAVAEPIRKQVLRLTHEEVPYAAAAVVDRMRDHESDKLQIGATIYIGRPGQKSIVIGRKDQILKQIRVATRQETKTLLGEKVNLRSWAKVQKNWRSDPAFLRSIGYNAKGLKQVIRKLCEVRGLVLKRREYKEAGILAKIMTEDRGILAIDVRKALRSKFRLGAVTLNFSYGKYIVNANQKKINMLRTFEDVKQLDQLYLDLAKNMYSSYALDLLGHAFVEYRDIKSLYDLIMKALLKVGSGEDAAVITQMVRLKLLSMYGVMSQLDRCLVCGEVQGTLDYPLKLGGVICGGHFDGVSQRMHLDLKVIVSVRTLVLVDVDRLGKVKISPQLRKSSGKVINRIYTNYSDLNLRTEEFLDELAFFQLLAFYVRSKTSEVPYQSLFIKDGKI